MDELNSNILSEDFFQDLESELEEIDFSSILDLPNPLDFLDSKEKFSEGENYIVFHLDEKIYGINSKFVSEIAPTLPITSLPNVPKWLLGVANLRGEIISVIDIRKIWGKNSETPVKTRMIIFKSPQLETSFAFLVDRVHEIITLSVQDIDYSSIDFAIPNPTFFGKANFKSNPLFLLNVDNILSSIEIAAPTALR